MLVIVPLPGVMWIQKVAAIKTVGFQTFMEVLVATQPVVRVVAAVADYYRVAKIIAVRASSGETLPLTNVPSDLSRVRHLALWIPCFARRVFSAPTVKFVVIATAEVAAVRDVRRDQAAVNAVRQASWITATIVEALHAKFHIFAWMDLSTQKTRFAALLHVDHVVDPGVKLDPVVMIVAKQVLPVPVHARLSSKPVVKLLGCPWFKLVPLTVEQSGFRFRSFFSFTTRLLPSTWNPWS